MTDKLIDTIPKCSINAGPDDEENWPERLMEEYQSIIAYIENNKENDTDWFEIESDESGLKWTGKCWHYENLLKYEFDVEFEIPVGFPKSAPEIAIPSLEGKTAKMYRGGFICLSDHFKPLWAKNSPNFGIAHAFALGLGPWLAVEVPDLISKGLIKKADE